MKKGDIVKIYEDPMTEQKLEGEATLIKKFPDIHNDPLEFWLVKFSDERQVRSMRWIKKKDQETDQ